jgi:Arc/MetJ-type ribon-helix-helix transcriptional regulator
MGVVTVRLNDRVSGFVDLLSSDTGKSRSEVVRELLTKATSDEKNAYWMRKYRNREVTLRKVAKELGVPLWKVMDIVKDSHGYDASDFERDLKSIGE